MRQLLIDNPLLTLFVVSAIGFAIGHIKIKGSSLGVAAVLFVGLFFGALIPELDLPEIMFSLGLVIFVYTIGLSSGPGFFRSFNREGLLNNLFTLIILLISAGIAVAAHYLAGLSAEMTAGVFAGSLTNTPALAAVLDYVRNAGVATDLAAQPVVGYSVTYPMGVLGGIIAIAVMQRIFRINYRKDAERMRSVHITEQEIFNTTVQVTKPEFIGKPLREIGISDKVIFGRLLRDDMVTLAQGDTVLTRGDLVSVIGTPEDVEPVVARLGEPAGVNLDLDRTAYDFRRIFVSSPQVAGRRLADLDLPTRYGSLVTRVRRGDIDLLARGDTVLELGDRVRVVAPRDNMRELTDLFGDSYKKLSEIDLLTFGLGIGIGLFIGAIPIPLPGGLSFKLGGAGGPLIVGLILGAVRRTGPLVWSLPYSANLTLRQVGLTLLLAVVGVRSGDTFLETFTNSGGLTIFLSGAAISLISTFLMLFVGYRLLKIPFSFLIGMMSAMATQPATLGYANEQTKNELPNLGYSLVFPIATISKILLAQLLAIFLS